MSFDGWVVAGLDGGRALSAPQLAQQLAQAGAQVVAAAADVPSACERALTLAGTTGRIVVFGSFLTVGPAIEWLRSRCVTLT
jgi:dihydrofolate synthase/folylpolyglutamate synthase